MRLSKVILFVISLVLVVGIAQAKINQNGALIIPKTSVAPVIDGNVDPIWRLVDATWLNYSMGDQKVDPWSDCAGWAKLLYDDSKVYGLYYVQDNVVDTISNTNWKMDGVEWYCDVSNTHTATVTVGQAGSTALQYCLRPREPVDSVKTAVQKGLDYKWLLDTASINNGGPVGYYLEFSFSLDSLGFETPPAVGKVISTQFQIDDNDNTVGERIHVTNWHYSPLNNDYQATAGWGDAVLGDLIDLKYVFLKTSTAPVIDGNLDAIWNDANQITMDFVQAQGAAGFLAPQAEVTDQDWRFYGLYDDTNIYGLFTVYDDVVDTISNTNWKMDGVEFYIDVSNTHTATVTVGQAGSTAYQYCLRPREPVDSVKTAVQKGLDYKWKLLNTVTNDSVFSSRSGWQLEFKLSLDSLGFTTPAVPGPIFSTQFQTDDNDNGVGERIHTTNWWFSPLNNDYQATAGWGDGKLGPMIPSVGVATQSGQVARSFELAQNYPNPFNPSTEISFTLAKSAKVRLAVYNLLGKEVAVLVNGTMSAGYHPVTFNAKNLSSGVYFYKLEAGSTVLAKKMMLLK